MTLIFRIFLLFLVTAKAVYAHAGENFVLASKQNYSESSGGAAGFNVSWQGDINANLNLQDAERNYTDDLSSIVGTDKVNTYTLSKFLAKI